MAGPTGSDGLPGLRLGQLKQALRADQPTQTGVSLDKSNAFNVAVAESPASPRGTEFSGRADDGLRTEVSPRREGAGRADGIPRSDSGVGRPESPARSGAVNLPDVASSSRLGVEQGEGAKSSFPVLRLGASGEAVGLLQRALAVLGYQSARSDDVFGPRTDEATRSFQASRGLAADGIVGNRETWPALNQALVTRHEGITQLAKAMGSEKNMAATQLNEMKQLGAVLTEVGERAVSTTPAPITSPTSETTTSDPLRSREQTYTVRSGETLSDVARSFNLPLSALIAANPELAKPYLVLQGQLLILPNPAKERRFRRPPRQLHAADPDGHLAGPNMNPSFVLLINGMIEWLRGDGYDVRVTAGFRTFSEQQHRFEQGRRTRGKILTDLEAGRSWHNYGLAVDMALNDEDGNPAWPEESSIFWQRLGDVALAHGASWGGLFGYPAHVEYHPQMPREKADSLIDEFESHGVEGVWARLGLSSPPDETSDDGASVQD